MASWLRHRHPSIEIPQTGPNVSCGWSVAPRTPAVRFPKDSVLYSHHPIELSTIFYELQAFNSSPMFRIAVLSRCVSARPVCLATSVTGASRCPLHAAKWSGVSPSWPLGVVCKRWPGQARPVGTVAVSINHLLPQIQSWAQSINLSMVSRSSMLQLLLALLPPCILPLVHGRTTSQRLRTRTSVLEEW